MKFRSERDILVDALTSASRAVSNRSPSPAALQGMRVEVAGNRLTVVGTDLDLTLRVETEAIGLDDGAFVAPAKLTADIVRSLEPGAVTLEGGEEEVEISAARSRFVVRTYQLEDFPVLPEPRELQVQLPVSTLSDALRQVVRAASTDDSRPLLTGVLVATEGEGVRLVATDSYRLAMRDMPGVDGLPQGTEKILVPARALAELQRLLGLFSKDAGTKDAGIKEDGGTRVGFSVSELDITFSVCGTHLTCRLLDGKFPDYRQLVPPSYPNHLRVQKEALLDALRRVKLLVRDNTTPVRLSMRGGNLDLAVVSQEIGQANEDMDADYSGEDLTVAFNPTYLIDGIEAVSGDEVVIETIDATKPATVRAPDHDDYRYLLMPVRVS